MQNATAETLAYIAARNTAALFFNGVFDFGLAFTDEQFESLSDFDVCWMVNTFNLTIDGTNLVP